jgi:monoamine oxidase
MARSALFQVIRRSMRLAQVSNHTGISPQEIVELRAERRGATRREFLGVTATAAAGLALSRCAPLVHSSMHADEPVVIIGGGIAGLTAAYRLEQEGVPVRLFEAQNRIGGRMFSIRNFFPEQQVAELGGELIDTNHESIRGLAAELGIQLNDLATDDPSLDTFWWFGGARRSEAEVIEAFKPLIPRIEAALATLKGDDVTWEAPNGGESLDRISIAEWLDSQGVDGWMRTLLDIGYTTEFGLETDEQPALNFLTMISTNDEAFEIFGESDERFHVQGGNDRIITALVERIRGPIETSSILEAVRLANDGSVVCTIRRGSTSFEVRAPEVVLTLPFTMLRQVRLDFEMPPAKRRAIDELGYGTNAKLMVGFESRHWRGQGCDGSVVTDRAFQACWETSRLQPGASGILTNFTGGRHGIELGKGTDAEQARLMLADLEVIFPGIGSTRTERSKEVRFHWPTHPFTRGSYASYRIGQWTSMRGVEGTPVGPIFFAGEHCSLESQGFMNGGSETGEEAARAIVARRNLSSVAVA